MEPMSLNTAEHDEMILQKVAAQFPYPPTPDIAQAVRLRLGQQPAYRRSYRLAWFAAVVVVFLAALLAVPPVRAQLAEWIQVGVVRIFLGGATPTPEPTTLPRPTPTLLPSLLDLDGETTLDTARQLAGFPVPLPSYPPDLGLPDHVFLQQMDAPFVILVWGDKQHPGKVALSLQIFTPGSVAAEKWSPTTITQTTVNGNDAAWVTGPYLLRLRNGNFDLRRLVEGNVLVWTQDGLTYRLETASSLEEAVKIAESIR
jgi:hypothetical protein